MMADTTGLIPSPCSSVSPDRRLRVLYADCACSMRRTIRLDLGDGCSVPELRTAFQARPNSFPGPQRHPGFQLNLAIRHGMKRKRLCDCCQYERALHLCKGFAQTEPGPSSEREI